MILALLAMVITLVVVVGIHEAGHALAATLFGVKIKRVAIGFGKPLLTLKDKSGREWVWALWPLGGYVHLLNSRIEKVPKKNYPLCFDKKPIWVRCIILVSGALANLLTAWLALTLLFMMGFEQQRPFIQKVYTPSIASQAGLQAHTRIVEVAGWKTNSWQEVGMSLIMALGKNKVPIWVSNPEETLHPVNLDLSQWRYQKKEPSLLSALGIEPAPAQLHTQHVPGKSFASSARYAMEQLGHLLTFFVVMLKQLITGVLPFAVLLGPLGLFAASVSSFFQGLAVFLSFIANLSLAVGLVNLFPIPGLDGGSIIYALIEKLRGKPVSIAVELLLYRLAFIIFAILLVQLLMNDLQRYLH
ncbi:M50 family metallopeptidase [Legionella drozanskii]|uniref:Membrane associated zinc metalloprotease n=1 Tax=Legionella drozanskii LLAP-1 TaxID=1212489 RepID=A0A0W0SR78_9GAMM|nr:site-2 protease family protein [Legionella drozanskii]KTC85910.1 membrane associated zinc metalloprotease [Legionella drozanskii LLAP-1]